MKLSLSRFIQRTSTDIGTERTVASGKAAPSARPVPAGPATWIPALRSRPRNALAAANAGWELTMPR